MDTTTNSNNKCIEMQTHNLLAKNLPPYPLGQGIWYTRLTVKHI